MVALGVVSNFYWRIDYEVNVWLAKVKKEEDHTDDSYPMKTLDFT